MTSKKNPETGGGGYLLSARATVTGRAEKTFGWRTNANGGNEGGGNVEGGDAGR